MVKKIVCSDCGNIEELDEQTMRCKKCGTTHWIPVENFMRMAHNLENSCDGDGCVVNYGGGREYWCKYADQDLINKIGNTVHVKCAAYDCMVIAAIG